jgi:hypothetical protein
MPNDRNDRLDPESREPRTEQLGRRNFAPGSYGATEQEQTRDLRLTDPGDPSDNEDDAGDADMANDDTGE